MDIIEQKLVVREWPLKNLGDQKFFGYVAAVGVFPRDGSGKLKFAFADFFYHEKYSRYELPPDPRLINQLLEYLCAHVGTAIQLFELCAQVWIRRTERGDELFTP